MTATSGRRLFLCPFPPRPFRSGDHHDSHAAPIANDDGILLIYNGSRCTEDAQEMVRRITPNYIPCFTKAFYSVGWALFDPKEPLKVIARAEQPFLQPERLYEFYGISDYTCFAQGLVNFKGKHILYYGCADMRIAAAYAEE